MKLPPLVALVLLAGCGGAPRQAYVKPDPVPESCSALCRMPCTTAGIRYTAGSDDLHAWDALVAQVVAPLSARLAQCDTHRLACVQCLDRLKAAGVTR